MQTLKHYGMCDASAAIALDSETFAVANDEDNFIKIYRARTSGKFITAIDISGYLNGRSSSKEADIEAAAELDGVIFWITSHGRNRKARRQESRYHFFANRMRSTGDRVLHEQIGRSCTHLLEDMLADKRLRKFDLKAAAKIPPKEKGGLNIEGLAATPDGKLLIGFRNPIVKKRALLLPLMNPFAVLQGDAAVFGEAFELDLDGLGVRSIDYWPGRDLYVIAAARTIAAVNSGSTPGAANRMKNRCGNAKSISTACTLKASCSTPARRNSCTCSATTAVRNAATKNAKI